MPSEPVGMTRAEAVQIIGRVFWGLQFVERKLSTIPAENRQTVQDAIDAATRNVPEWRGLARNHARWTTLTQRVVALDAPVAEALLTYLRDAVAFGFERLRSDVDYRLALAEADEAKWGATLAVLQAPGDALNAIGKAIGRTVGVVAQATGAGLAAGLTGLLSGLLSSPGGWLLLLGGGYLLLRKTA